MSHVVAGVRVPLPVAVHAVTDGAPRREPLKLPVHVAHHSDAETVVPVTLMRGLVRVGEMSSMNERGVVMQDLLSTLHHGIHFGVRPAPGSPVLTLALSAAGTTILLLGEDVETGIAVAPHLLIALHETELVVLEETKRPEQSVDLRRRPTTLANERHRRHEQAREPTDQLMIRRINLWSINLPNSHGCTSVVIRSHLLGTPYSNTN